MSETLDNVGEALYSCDSERRIASSTGTGAPCSHDGAAAGTSGRWATRSDGMPAEPHRSAQSIADGRHCTDVEWCTTERRAPRFRFLSSAAIRAWFTHVTMPAARRKPAQAPTGSLLFSEYAAVLFADVAASSAQLEALED